MYNEIENIGTVEAATQWFTIHSCFLLCSPLAFTHCFTSSLKPFFGLFAIFFSSSLFLSAVHSSSSCKQSFNAIHQTPIILSCTLKIRRSINHPRGHTYLQHPVLHLGEPLHQCPFDFGLRHHGLDRTAVFLQALWGEING